MDMASVFEWFAQESWAAAELTHEQPQREIWLRLALIALRSREEAEALGKNTAVYLSGAAPRAAQGWGRRAERGVGTTCPHAALPTPAIAATPIRIAPWPRRASVRGHLCGP